MPLEPALRASARPRDHRGDLTRVLDALHEVGELGTALLRDVVAEQHLFLRAAGVHSMQGYRFGRPGSVMDITTRLAEPGSFRIVDDPASLAMAG